jgi:hypothetical protein
MPTPRGPSDPELDHVVADASIRLTERLDHRVSGRSVDPSRERIAFVERPGVVRLDPVSDGALVGQGDMSNGGSASEGSASNPGTS